jgi:hypothetical protein
LEKPPPPPEGWCKTLADLSAELNAGLRKTLESPEVDWARDYERSLLPAATRFPCKGDVYEALEDFEVPYMTSWAAPFTGGGKARLKQGDQIEIPDSSVIPQPILVYARAVKYAELEARMVPESERKAKSYTGFYFAVKTSDLNTKFRLVRSAEEPQ